ncbi:NrdH-redoxin [Candidatus Woesearchaeota archaeon]|nr:NrdH-redoxin [Candidatus Woesearchaeota archaeon]
MTKEHKIIIYRTQLCTWCHRAEEFFKANNIKFTTIFVDRDRKAAEEMIRKSGQMAVPVTDINGDIIIGDDVDSFKRLLNIN